MVKHKEFRDVMDKITDGMTDLIDEYIKAKDEGRANGELFIKLDFSLEAVGQGFEILREIISPKCKPDEAMKKVNALETRVLEISGLFEEKPSGKSK